MLRCQPKLTLPNTFGLATRGGSNLYVQLNAVFISFHFKLQALYADLRSWDLCLPVTQQFWLCVRNPVLQLSLCAWSGAALNSLPPSGWQLLADAHQVFVRR